MHAVAIGPCCPHLLRLQAPAAAAAPHLLRLLLLLLLCLSAGTCSHDTEPFLLSATWQIY
jgi:hypothetical protein